jgi:diguanylate cyclase (GGDEF)-like protein
MPDIPKLNTGDEDDEDEAEVTRMGAVAPEQPLEIPLGGYLTVIVGQHPGRVYALDAPTMVIGRGAECAVRLEGDGVSRNHARITRHAGQYTIEDLGSTNGTFIDGALATADPIKSGARIRVGTHVTLRFNLFDEEEAALQKRLYENVIQDTLTGAYNRRFFEQTLGNEVAQAKRLSTPLAVVAVQVDDVKRIIDYYTQAGADAFLRKLAKIVQGAGRPEDILARIEHDQFGLIIRGLQRPEVGALGEKIRSEVEVVEVLWQSGDFSLCIEQVTVTVAIVTLADATTLTADGLLVEMAKRLDEGKQQGGNTVIGAS